MEPVEFSTNCSPPDLALKCSHRQTRRESDQAGYQRKAANKFFSFRAKPAMTMPPRNGTSVKRSASDHALAPNQKMISATSRTPMTRDKFARGRCAVGKSAAAFRVAPRSGVETRFTKYYPSTVEQARPTVII